jgi:hypothetical protein
MAFLRPSEEFPTPAFRIVAGWVAGGIAFGIAVWTQEPSRAWEVALACVAFFGAVLPLWFGRTVPRLAVSALAVAALVGAVASVA